MAIVPQIIKVYESCQALLKAKKSLYVDVSGLNAFFQRPQLNTRDKRNLCVEQIEDGILKLMRIWCKNFGAYELLQDEHKHSIAQLELKINALKNSSGIFSKSDHQLSQIETLMAEWSQNMNPVEYYNIKFRKNFKESIQQKLLHLKISLFKSNGTPPLDMRKIEEQCKENLKSIYYEELKIDIKLLETTSCLYSEVSREIGVMENKISQNISHYEPSLQNDYFIKQTHDILSPTKPSDKKMQQYYQFLREAVIDNYQFWHVLRKSLDNMLIMLNQLQKVLVSGKTVFENKLQKILQIVGHVPNSVSHIFQIDLIYSMIEVFTSAFGTITILQSFKQKIFIRREFCLKEQNQSRQYSQRLTVQTEQRYSNFLHFVFLDKRFFEDRSKSERITFRLLMENFHDFLANFMKEAIKNFQEHKIIQFQQNILCTEIGRMVGSQQTKTESTQDEEHQSQQAAKKKMLIRQKVEKIEHFLENFSIFKSDSILQQNDKVFTCALGPRLLLHGKLHLLPEGLFFKSKFNKKNLLFGTTKIFIPRSDIEQIDVKKTFLVFPDAVLVKTQRGFVSFHALGQRKTISDALMHTYLLDEAQQDHGNFKVEEKKAFHSIDPTKSPTDDKIQKAIKPFSTIINQSTFRGSDLGTIFRRYLSDDKFEKQGVSYPCFKNYSILQIGGKDPSSTPLTPPHPTYFQYKQQKNAQNYPESSTRIHKYLKDMPKIPFLSKGGSGQCEQKQEYIWLGQQLLVINVLSTVKGFSLTQAMQIYVKYVFKQIKQGVKITISSQIKFTKQSSINNLLKGPTITNMRQTLSKIMHSIQQCERSSRGNPKVEKQDVPIFEQHDQKQQDPVPQIQLSRKQVLFIGIGFMLFYLVTILATRLL